MSIVLADSNDLVRAGLRSIIATQTGLSIVGEATSNEELLEQLKSFETKIILIDFTSHGFDIDIIPKIQSLNKSIKFIAITPEQNAQTLVDALRLGVMSYVKKDCELSEIVNAVNETSRGNKFFMIFCSKVAVFVFRLRSPGSVGNLWTRYNLRILQQFPH